MSNWEHNIGFHAGVAPFLFTFEIGVIILRSTRKWNTGHFSHLCLVGGH